VGEEGECIAGGVSGVYHDWDLPLLLMEYGGGWRSAALARRLLVGSNC